MRLKGPIRKILGMSKRDHGHHVGVEYHVPYVHQNHVNLCGDASAQIVLMYYERPLPLEMKPNFGPPNDNRLMHRRRKTFDGATDDDIVDLIRRAGLYAWNIRPEQGRWTQDLVRA